jgi:hypothetical protein
MSKPKNETTNLLWAKSPSGVEIKIPILGLCGEFESGKTLWGITIAPGKHPAGHPFEGLARTIVIDLEKSSENYAESNLGFDRIDLPQQLMSNPNKKAYTSIDLYEEFRKTTLAIPDKRYDVMFIDPITDIDSGLTDYVRENPEKFGLTKNKIEKTTGLLWGVVKEEWNKLLLLLSTKCKTFCFSAHMRDLYIGNTPSGKREPKGKETLAKLATLYLELARKPKNGVIPSVPTGIKLKSRISDSIFNEKTGEITTIELLPKVIENCTPAKIRSLIANPSKDVIAYYDDHLTDDMRLAFQVEKESKRAEAANAELELQNRRDKLIAGMVKPDEVQETVKNVDTTISKNVSTKEPSGANLSTADSLPPPPPYRKPQPATEPPQTVSPPEPKQPKKKAAKTENVETEAETPVKTPVKTSDNPMYDGAGSFPPADYDRAVESEFLKNSLTKGYYTKDNFAQALKLFNVTKLSELSDTEFESICDHAHMVKNIIDETVKRNIPRAKLEEFAEKAKEPSFFVSSMETKQKILSVITNIPIPEKN